MVYNIYLDPPFLKSYFFVEVGHKYTEKVLAFVYD